MANRPIRSEEFNWATTLAVRDAKAALDFYTNVFGFTEQQKLANKNGKVIFARITYKSTSLVIMPHSPFPEETHRGVAPTVTKIISPISIYVYCDDLDERYEKIKECGVKVLLSPDLRFWGDKTFRVEDPEGYIWDFATCVTEFDPNKLPLELK